VHPIVPMAIITLLLSAALWCGMLWLYSGRTMRYVRLVWLGLPLSAVVNLLVKAPIGEGVGRLVGIEPGRSLDTPVWFLLLFMLAPVFEELIKVVPVLLGRVRRGMATADDALWTGMALGLGFGLGEAAYLAWQVVAAGVYTEYPWYAFTGFLGERLIVVFLHGMMTAILLRIAASGRRLLGYLAAMSAHAILNSGAALFQLGLVPGWAADLVLVAMTLGAVLLLERIRPKRGAPERTDDVIYYQAGE